MADKYDEMMANFGKQLASVGGATGPTGSTSSADDPLLAPVYMGNVANPSSGPERYEGKPIPGAEGGLSVGRIDRVTTVGDAYDDFHRMSAKERQRFADKLIALGWIEPGGYTYADLQQYWQAAVNDAADIYRATGKRVSPNGVLNMNRQIQGGSAAGEPFDKRDVSKSTEDVNNRSVSLTNKQDARSALRQSFQQELGRDPTRKETRVFYRALRAAERANPTVTTGTRSSRTVTTRQENGNSQNRSSSSDNTTTRQGVDPSAFLDNYVDDRYDKEQDARRTATDYYDALLGLAGGG